MGNVTEFRVALTVEDFDRAGTFPAATGLPAGRQLVAEQVH
jgi:hypothetical protein